MTDLIARVREQAREFNEKLPGGSFADGAAWLASRLTRENIEEALRPVITEHHDAGANDQWWVSDHAADYADVVLELMTNEPKENVLDCKREEESK